MSGDVVYQNHSQTCYASAVLQALRACGVAGRLKAAPRSAAAAELLRLLAAGPGSQREAHEPRDVSALLRLLGGGGGGDKYAQGEHCDAAEFLDDLLCALDAAAPRPPDACGVPQQTPGSAAWVRACWSHAAHASPGLRAMGTQVLRLQACRRCGRRSAQCDVARSLRLPLQQGDDLLADPDAQALLRRLADAPPQPVAEFVCDGCGKRGTTVTDETVVRLPPVLALHLMRFAAGGQKLATRVRLELELDLTPLATRPGLGGVDVQGVPCRAPGDVTCYRLAAVVYHRGASAHCGHYYAAARTPAGGWRLYDDELASPLQGGPPPDDAYLAFYTL